MHSLNSSANGLGARAADSARISGMKGCCRLSAATAIKGHDRRMRGQIRPE
jgi:hypothetical protein